MSNLNKESDESIFWLVFIKYEKLKKLDNSKLKDLLIAANELL